MAKPLSRRMLNNIRDVFHRATSTQHAEGRYWYDAAHGKSRNLAERTGVPLPVAVGVVAALSPGCPWERNFEQAEKLIASFALGNRGDKLPNVGVYGRANVRKAEKILLGADPPTVLGERAPKVQAFYRAILNPIDKHVVVVDRHAKGVAVNARGDKETLVKPGEYEYIARHYRHVARGEGIIPSQLQAICWVVWRGAKKATP